MLASSANQYLRPEYLTPLPTTLDAKKSPLALLAQTCSQIGSDPSSTTGKSLLTSLEKSNNNKSHSKSSESSLDKSSPGQVVSQGQNESHKMSFKPYESCLGQEKSSTPDEQRSNSSHSMGRSRTPGSNGKRCPSNQSASSNRAVTPQGRKSTTPNGDIPTRESPSSRIPSSYADSITTAPSSQHQTLSSPSSHSKSSYSPAGVLSMSDLPLGSFKTNMSLPSSTIPSSSPSSSSPSYSLGYTHQLPIDVMTNSLMSQHHAAAAAAALKNGLSGNPYLAYSRLKGAGAEGLMQVCRDPYCTGCQLNSHFLASSAGAVAAATANGKLANTSTTRACCAAGCSQCDHNKPNGNSHYGSLGAAYAHAQLAALAAASQLPYVCNWIAGDTAYCGKRFSTSEELLQHLRSHTNISTGINGTSSSDSSSAATAAALSLLSPPVGLPPTHPLFSRNYPTPPLSPLATARYHPYGKPMLPPQLSSLGLPMPHPHSAGFPPYFSPYSLYGGPRLGATSGMHP